VEAPPGFEPGVEVLQFDHRWFALPRVLRFSEKIPMITVFRHRY
jgi:hypothetical protein